MASREGDELRPPERVEEVTAEWLTDALAIEHVYEEFDDDHSNTDYRMDVSLPFLYHTLTAE